MAEPKFRIVLRFFAVVIACSYFAALATGLIPQPQLFQLIKMSAMMVVFLVFGLFGLKPAEALMGMFVHPPCVRPAVLGISASRQQEMKPTQTEIGTAKVIAFTTTDQRHQPAGTCCHIVAGELGGPVAGLAICKYEADSGYHLLYCDAEWNTITDTYHDTLQAAKHQAECEYEGVSSTWQHLDALSGIDEHATPAVSTIR
jgi:hypothetical protein